MHHAEYNRHQFNYNGDYSGEIHVIDNIGFDWPPMSFEDMLRIIEDPEAQHMDHVIAFRVFVGEAVRHSLICELERMDTHELLDGLSSEQILRNVKESQ